MSGGEFSLRYDALHRINPFSVGEDIFRFVVFGTLLDASIVQDKIWRVQNSFWFVPTLISNLSIATFVHTDGVVGIMA